MCDDALSRPQTPPYDPPDTSDIELDLDSDSTCSSGNGDRSTSELYSDQDRSRSPRRKRQRSLPPDTLILIDWDDTLLPSTWLHQQGLTIDKGELSEIHRVELGCAAAEVASTLRCAKRLGSVVVVTNAEWGWVELSCKRFLPTLWPILEGVKIRSARSLYEPIVGLSPLLWKRNAFLDELRVFCRQGELLNPKGTKRGANVVSLGDSAHERDALITATQDLTDCWGKSVKFIERPTLIAFVQQHRLLKTCFQHVVKHKGSLDLCLRQGEQCNLIGLAQADQGVGQPSTLISGQDV